MNKEEFIEGLMKNIDVLNNKRVPTKVKMKEEYYNKLKILVGRKSSMSIETLMGRFNDIPIVIDNKIDEDFKFIYGDEEGE